MGSNQSETTTQSEAVECAGRSRLSAEGGSRTGAARATTAPTPHRRSQARPVGSEDFGVTASPKTSGC